MVANYLLSGMILQVGDPNGLPPATRLARVKPKELSRIFMDCCLREDWTLPTWRTPGVPEVIGSMVSGKKTQWNDFRLRK